MVSKKLEDMNQEEKVSFLEKSWKNLDMTLFFAKVEWDLREPKCSCDFCDQIYQGWLNEGKKIYQNQIDSYEKIVQEANLRREQRKISRQVKRGNQQLVSAYSLIVG